jgi:hypothetical protein
VRTGERGETKGGKKVEGKRRHENSGEEENACAALQWRTWREGMGRTFCVELSGRNFSPRTKSAVRINFANATADQSQRKEANTTRSARDCGSEPTGSEAASSTCFGNAKWSASEIKQKRSNSYIFKQTTVSVSVHLERTHERRDASSGYLELMQN